MLALACGWGIVHYAKTIHKLNNEGRGQFASPDHDFFSHKTNIRLSFFLGMENQLFIIKLLVEN
jgi:hypothetical protein